MKNIFQTLIYFLISGLICACFKKDFDRLDSNYNPDIATPLINARISVEQILGEVDSIKYHKIGSDGLVTLIYSGTILSIEAKDKFDFPNQNLKLTDTSLNVTFKTNENDQLELLRLKSGIIDINIEKSSPDESNFVFEIPNATKNGVPFYYSTQLTNSSNKISIDLSGYEFNLNQNNIEFRYGYLLDGKKERINETTATIKNLVFDYIEGAIGDRLYTLSTDTIRLDYFKNWKSGVISLIDPQFKLTMVNSFGIPLTASINNFIVNNGEEAIVFTDTFFNDNAIINYPDSNSNQDFEISIQTFTNLNESFQTSLSLSPDFLSYSFALEGASKAALDSFNYVYYDSKIDLLLDLEIPLKLQLENIVIEDLYEIDFKPYVGFRDVVFKIITTNKFPIDLNLQVYFVDDRLNILDSLMSNNQRLLKAYPGVISPDQNEFQIEFDGEKLKTIEGSTKLLIKAKLESLDHGSKVIEIKEQDNLEIFIGVKTGLKL